MILKNTIATPVGMVELSVEDNNLVAVDIVESHPDAPFKNPLIKSVADQLHAYFNGTLTAFNVPIVLKGTEFQQKVWRALLEIPYGQTNSYSDIAKRLGSPKACRAVGQAISNNPLAIVIPCHRVIGKDGSLTGFASGLEKKRILLALERKNKRCSGSSVD